MGEAMFPPGSARRLAVAADEGTSAKTKPAGVAPGRFVRSARGRRDQYLIRRVAP